MVFNTFDIPVPYVVTDIKTCSCEDLMYEAKYIGDCMQYPRQTFGAPEDLKALKSF